MNSTHRAVCYAAAILLAGCAASFGVTVAEGQTGAAGAAAPPVVFISGFNSGANTWNDIARQVSGFTTTFAFERPGYGGTPPAPSDADGLRTDVEVAAMLEDALRRNDIQRPFVLVAHSLGAQYALRYARLHPQDVAAVILLDGRLHEFAVRCRAAGQNCTPPPPPSEMPEHLAAEMRASQALEASDPDPRAITELGDVPIVVVSRNTGGSPAQLGMWQEALRSFAAAVSNGRYVLAEKSGHGIHRDEPELVLREIRSAVETASSRR